MGDRGDKPAMALKVFLQIPKKERRLHRDYALEVAAEVIHGQAGIVNRHFRRPSSGRRSA